MNQPKISVICVTYNAAEHIQNCIDSIAAQRYENIELVILDGGSVDGTQDILEQNNSKISYWHSKPDKGIYDAMNQAIDFATGDWLYFIGADDKLLPGFSDFVENEFKDSSCIYYANVMYKGKKIKGEVSPYFQAKLGIFHQAMLYPKTVFEKYRYDPKYKVSADFALNIALCGDKDYKFVYRDYVIAFYNDTGFSSYVVDEAFLADHYSIVMKNCNPMVRFRFWFRNLKSKR